MLPTSVAADLRQHLARGRQTHDLDLKSGVGCVALPDALATPEPRGLGVRSPADRL